MQNTNNFIDLISDFLKANNLKSDDIFEKIFNFKNNSSNIEEVIKEKTRKPFSDSESDDDYEVLINKLNSIKNDMSELSQLIKNKID